MPASPGYAFDPSTIGQQPGAGGWWGGAGRTSGPITQSGASGVRPAGGMDLSSLTQFINSLNLGAQQRANAGRIPGATGLETTSSANIANELAGNVSPSTIRLLQQQAAERGAATGVGAGSPNSTAAYLQALGLTSEQLQQQGQRDLTAAEGRNPGAPIFDPTTQLMTPYQSEQLNLERQRLAQDGSSGGGGGYAAPRVGAGNVQGPSSVDYTGGTDTGTPGSAAAPFDWFASTFAPGGQPTTGSQPYSYYAGPNTEEDIAASLGWTGPLSPSTPDTSIDDWLASVSG